MMQIKPAGGMPAPAPMEQGPQPYPSMDQMPEMTDTNAASMEGEDNPVMQALRTLTLYTSAAAKQGDPKADLLMQHLKGFVESMLSEGGAPSSMDPNAMAPAGLGGEPALEAPASPMGAPAGAPPAPMGPESSAAETPMPSMDAGAIKPAFNALEAPPEPMIAKKPMKSQKNQTRVLF